MKRRVEAVVQARVYAFWKSYIVFISIIQTIEGVHHRKCMKINDVSNGTTIAL